MSVGKNVKKYREEIGLNQTELAEKFENVYRMIYRQVMQIIENRRMRVERCTDRPVFKDPIRGLENQRQYLDNLAHMFETAVKNSLADYV